MEEDKGYLIGRGTLPAVEVFRHAGALSLADAVRRQQDARVHRVHRGHFDTWIEIATLVEEYGDVLVNMGDAIDPDFVWIGELRDAVAF